MSQLMRRNWKRVGVAKGGAAVLSAVLVLEAAAPLNAFASSHSVAVQKIGPNTSLTMTEWNWETVADDPNYAAILPQLIKGFEAMYPHIKVVNTSMSLEEQTDKLPLDFANASSTPVVSQTNEGFGSMGRLVADKELLPLNGYDKLYNWSARVGRLPIQTQSFSSDGVNYGVGDVYGVPDNGVVVGVFYNKAILASVGAKPPTSWATFDQDLAMVKKAGKVALSFGGGQPTEYQPEHQFQFLLDEFVPAKQLTDWIFHIGANPTIDTADAVKAAETYVSWAKDGYFNPGYQGTSVTQALNLFDTGKTAMFIEGNWHVGAVHAALGSKAGFWVPPEATGSVDEGWSIPAKSTDPNAAAAWINWVLSPQAQALQLKAGDIPVTALSAKALSTVPPIAQSAATGWKQLVTANQLVTFMDWAAPPLLNDIAADVGELLAGQTSPKSMISSLQNDYSSWASTHYK
jgi:raffinose/stachyose/melibiose transport system substrate-binding protein